MSVLWKLLVRKIVLQEYSIFYVISIQYAIHFCFSLVNLDFIIKSNIQEKWYFNYSYMWKFHSFTFAQSAGAVKYIDCISAEG